MKAARLVGPQRYALVEEETPSPKEGECLIHIQRVSVCGSDLRRAFRPTLPEERYPLPVGLSGHECAGTVVESRCTQVQEGQRVVVHPHSLQGLVEYLAVPPNRLAVVPQDNDLEGWLMCEPPATILPTCRQIGNVVGKRVVILGQGAIGLCQTLFMERLGAREIIVTDLEDYRLERARRLGATHTLNAARVPALQAVEELTRGEMADVVIEAAGEVETVQQAPRFARHGGTVVFFGTTEEELVPVDFRTLRTRELNTICTAPGRGDQIGTYIQEMVALRERGWMDPAQFITHRLPFSQVQRAFEMYHRREDGIIKVVLSLEE
ncbi:MAG: zinc-binding dehydrogenase [Dehalococcoidia bacterium]